MLEANVKEYEILKNEIADIKSCITRYVTYIIGTNGLVLLLYKISFYKYLNPEPSSTIEEITNELGSLSPFYDYMPIVAVTIIFSLYFVLSYKFASHNRYIGYIQLLSKEVKYLKIKKKKDYKISKNKHLHLGYNQKKNREITDKELPSTIISWESTISRFNSRLKPTSFPKRHYDNLDFRFLLNRKSKYKHLKKYKIGKESYNVIQGFLKNIIWEYYYKSFGKISFYNKYDVKSWMYPGYIFFLVIIQCLLITPFLSFIQVSLALKS